MFALHRVGLTAEDDIAVERRDSMVVVSGLTTTDARRRQLSEAIARIAHVRARIQTADEVLSEKTAAPAGPARPTRSVRASKSVEDAPAPVVLRMDEAVIEAARVPVQALAAGGSADAASRAGVTREEGVVAGPDEASMRRAREAVRQSLALLERAWALRRLAEWSRRTNASTVTASTRELIDLMVREHADAASKALAALDTTVTPSLPAVSPMNPDGAVDRDASVRDREPGDRAWVDVATDFFGVAAEIDRDTRRLFTASPTPTTEAAEEARRLRHGLDRAAQWLLALRQPQPPHP